MRSLTQVSLTGALAWIIGLSTVQSAAASEPTAIDRNADPALIERSIPKPMPTERSDNKGIDGLQSAPGPARGPTGFVLGGVRIVGATVFSPEELAGTYEPMLATTVDSNALRAITDRITKRYRDAGYILSHAFIPPQKPRAGIVEVRVVEGYIEEVQFTGDAEGPSFNNYAERLRKERPLTLDTLEHVLALLRDLSGVTVEDTRVRRSPADPQRHTLVVRVRQDRMRGFAFVDNRGTDSVGRFRTFGSIAVSSLLRTGDELKLGVFTIPDDPDEFTWGNASFTTPIGSDGWRVTVAASLSEANPGGLFRVARTVGDTFDALVEASYPLRRSRKTSTWLTGSFDLRSVDQQQFDQPVIRDRLRVARLSLSHNYSMKSGRIDVWAQLSQGLDIWDATERSSSLASRRDGSASFTKFAVDLSMTRTLVSNVDLVVAAAAQLASRPLLSSEEFSLGGARYGRAFDYSELTGDHGVAGSIELDYTMVLSGSDRIFLQLYAFGDGGWVFNDAVRSFDGSDGLTSAGVGARLFLGNSFQIDAVGAIPIGRAPYEVGDRDPRLFFSASTSF